jgi:hypothetical protein
MVVSVGISASAGREWGSVDDIEVVDLMRAAPAFL